jgi:hypothetical protein
MPPSSALAQRDVPGGTTNDGPEVDQTTPREELHVNQNTDNDGGLEAESAVLHKSRTTP